MGPEAFIPRLRGMESSRSSAHPLGTQTHRPPRTLRAVRAGPASQAVAGPIRRVAGGMVGTLAGHTAFAIAARLTGWGKGARGDWEQGPTLSQPLTPPSPCLLPAVVTSP